MQATKDLLVAVDEVALELIKQFKDGVQFSDFVAFYNDFQNNPDFRAKLETAWNEHQQVAGEIKAISLADAVDLISVEVAYVPKFIEALK